MSDQKQVLDSLFDGLYTVTCERKITYWNNAAEEITGYTAEELVGTYCYDGPLKHVDKEGNDLCSDGCPLTWAISHRCKHEDEIFLKHKDGFRVPINVRVSPLCDSTGRVHGASELFKDNTPTGAIAERLAELEELALVDPLTRLANAKYAREQIEQSLKEMQRYPLKVGVAIFKIDNIDLFIKAHGRKAFDQFQTIASQTLAHNSRPLDLIARIDEGCFLGIFRNVTDNLLDSTCEKMRLLFAKSSFPLGGATISGTFSAGGHCLRNDDNYTNVIEHCHKYLSECQKDGGNRSRVSIRLLKVKE